MTGEVSNMTDEVSNMTDEGVIWGGGGGISSLMVQIQSENKSN